MRLLFVKHGLSWPLASGHDVHTFHMLKACADLGHEIALATRTAVVSGALDGLPLRFHEVLEDANGGDSRDPSIRFSWLQERYRSYWGIDHGSLARLRKRAREYCPDAFVVVGLDGLVYLPAAPEGAVRVWYAADEWIWHHLSLVRAEPSTWREHLRAAAVKGLYERAYAPLIDRAWVVSPSEQRAMRWLAGVKRVDVLPNGVDADFYRPQNVPEWPASAVFWGRLDFEPNIQALTWFCREVWPPLREQVRDARLTIIGFNLTPAVEALGRLPGVHLKPDLPDLRAEVSQHAAVVLPFVSGGGIKNKLLEAAALAKPIVCSPRAAGGLRFPSEAALAVATTPAEWVQQLQELWADDRRRRQSGEACRAWVVARHSWASTAQEAMSSLQSSMRCEGVA